MQNNPTHKKGSEKKAKQPITYAFIDSQNLNLGVSADIVRGNKKIYSGKKLNYRKFRHYLRERYGVSKAFIFIGAVPVYSPLYVSLQEAGYTLIFKTVSWYIDENGKTIVKGNVDTDIVLYSVGELFDEYDQAIFVSGDGDFLSLYRHIDKKHKLLKIIAPNRLNYSKLLNEYRKKLAFVADIPGLFQPKQKTRSSGRITSLGQPGHGDNTIIPNRAKKVNIKGKNNRKSINPKKTNI
jgi:hypothetical protein